MWAVRREKGSNVWNERYHVLDGCVCVRCVCARVVIGANHTTLTKHNATTEPKPTRGLTGNPRVKVGCTSQLVDTQ